jgi:hypothetical protein
VEGVLKFGRLWYIKGRGRRSLKDGRKRIGIAASGGVGRLVSWAFWNREFWAWVEMGWDGIGSGVKL